MARPPKKSPPKRSLIEKIKEKKTMPKKPSEEFSTFAGDPNFQKLLYALATEELLLRKQKRRLRWVVCAVAIVAVFVFGLLEYGILQNIKFLSTIPGDLIFLVASPILAVTAIVVSFLISVFRVNIDNAGPATQIFGGASSGSG